MGICVPLARHGVSIYEYLEWMHGHCGDMFEYVGGKNLYV